MCIHIHVETNLQRRTNTFGRIIIYCKLSSVLVWVQVQGIAQEIHFWKVCVRCGEGCLKARTCLCQTGIQFLSCSGFHRWLHLSWSAGLLWELGGSLFESVESAGLLMDLCAWLFNICMYLCVCVSVCEREINIILFLFYTYLYIVILYWISVLTHHQQLMLAWSHRCDFISSIGLLAELKGTKINSWPQGIRQLPKQFNRL